MLALIGSTGHVAAKGPLEGNSAVSALGLLLTKAVEERGRKSVSQGLCSQVLGFLICQKEKRQRLPRGTSTALPLHTIFADNILITCTFLQLRRAPQTHILDDIAQKLAAGDDNTLDNITLAQDIAIRDTSPGH
ncbi:hypothetical protein H8959_009589 [Pygathrix nigripes]